MSFFSWRMGRSDQSDKASPISGLGQRVPEAPILPSTSAHTATLPKIAGKPLSFGFDETDDVEVVFWMGFRGGCLVN